MKRQVTYLMSGSPHLPYLVVSAYTLRRAGYCGDIHVYAWPESFSFVQDIAKDDKLGIQCFLREPKLRRKDGVGSNSQFIDKIDLTMGLRCDTSLYLDADTEVQGDVTPLDVSGNDVHVHRVGSRIARLGCGDVVLRAGFRRGDQRDYVVTVAVRLDRR